MRHYLYKTLPPRANFAETLSTNEEKIIGEHFNYLKDLTAQGVVYLAGRVEDASFGIVVFEAESPEKAEEVMLNDPAVKAGLFRTELYPYRLALFKGQD